MLLRLLLLAAPLLALSPQPVHAETPAMAAMRGTAEQFLRAATADQPGEARIEIGRLPQDTRYAACRKWEPFLPAGARVWGRLSLGMRCAEGMRASFYIPTQVRVFGAYLVAARTISIGQSVQAEDLQITEGERSQQAADLLLEPAQALGYTARTTIPAGRPLQAAHLRLPPLIEAGEQVKLIANGSGFAVTNSGQALSSAIQGQRLRVRLASGRVVEAWATAPGTAEIRH